MIDFYKREFEGETLGLFSITSYPKEAFWVVSSPDACLALRTVEHNLPPEELAEISTWKTRWMTTQEAMAKREFTDENGNKVSVSLDESLKANNTGVRIVAND